MFILFFHLNTGSAIIKSDTRWFHLSGSLLSPGNPKPDDLHPHFTYNLWLCENFIQLQVKREVFFALYVLTFVRGENIDVKDQDPVIILCNLLAVHCPASLGDLMSEAKEPLSNTVVSYAH